MFRYVYDNNGIFGSVSYQTAADGSSVAGNNADVEGGLQQLLVTLSITLYLAHYHSRQVTHTSRVRMISLRPSFSLRIQRLLITSR